MGLFFFFFSWCVSFLRGRSLRCSPGRGNAGLCTVTLHVGEGPRGSNGARSTLHQISVTPSATHNQTGPLWCWFPNGWVSPMTSPVRMGVSPAAAPTPRGIFNQRFEALFPCAGVLGCSVCFGPRCLSGLSVHKCGASGSSSGQTACAVGPTLRQSRSHHSNASPLCPSCLSPPLLPVWLNVYFLFPWCWTHLPLDSLSVLVVRGGAVCLPTPPSWFSRLLVLLVFLSLTKGSKESEQKVNNFLHNHCAQLHSYDLKGLVQFFIKTAFFMKK